MKVKKSMKAKNGFQQQPKPSKKPAKRDSVPSEMFPGKMIPIGASNYENKNIDKMLSALKPKPAAKPKATIKKKAQGGDSLKAKLKSDIGGRSYSVDTTGYAAGKKKFPATVSYGKGKSAPVKVGRVAVSKMMSPGGRKRSSSK